MKKIGLTILLLISFLCMSGCHNGNASLQTDPSDKNINVPKKSETPAPEDEIPGKFSPDLILDGVIAWAESDLGVSQVGAYALKYKDENISSDRVIMMESGDIIGYFMFANSQTVQRTEMGDVVYGKGVDSAEKIISEEANKTGKKSYTDFMKHWAFFIIADDPNDLVGYYRQ